MGDGGLTVSLDAWEGPLDLLLGLARAQKVDLREISVAALAAQYVAYVEDARRLDLEVAADHLVTAAWLAYLKSALLLPREADADPDPDALAAALALRLRLLDAMRTAGEALLARPQRGRDTFARGAPEGLGVAGGVPDLSIHALLTAYGRVAARTAPVRHHVRARPVMTLEEALERLRALIGDRPDWRPLTAFLPETRDPDYRRSAAASSFVAALELARVGAAEIRQTAPFDPVMMRPVTGQANQVG